MRTLLVLGVVAACSRNSPGGQVSAASDPTGGGAPPSASAPSTIASAPVRPPSGAPPSIGVARMRADGALELDLRGPGGAEARLVYPPTHAKYKETLDHLGGMKPGEEKPVPPWPDPWDAAKVEAAAHAWAKKQGHVSGAYTIEIMGTDKAGNAVVSVNPRDGKPASIRVETKSYTVVAP